MEARTHASALEESAIIERVARIVFSVRGTKPDYTRLAAELEQAVPFDIFGVILLRHDRQAVRVTVCKKDTGKWVAVPHQHPLTDSMLEQVLATPVLQVHDYPDGLDGPPATSGDALSGYHQLRSTLIAPLVVEDRVLGTLELGSTALHTYTDSSLQRLVSAVVRVLAAAIESVQLGGNAAIQDRQRQALKDVTSALTSKDLSTILEQIVVGVANALNVSSCIVLLNRREGMMRLEAQHGLNPEVAARIFNHKLSVIDSCILCQALLRQQVLVSHDIANDERFSAGRQFFTELGLHSIFCYPLVTGTAVYGILLACSTEAGGFTPLKTDILALFANQATVAIHNGMLLESMHQRSRFQEAVERLELAHVSRKQAEVQQRQDLQTAEFELLERVREETQETFGVNFGSLLRFLSDHLLTQNERDLQSVFYPLNSEQTIELMNLPDSAGAAQMQEGLKPPVEAEEQKRDRKDPFARTLELLEQTAESALTRAAMLGELSRLIVQLKQSTNWVQDAWFVIDLDGSCLYMNPAAEFLCDTTAESMATTYDGQLLAPASKQRQNEPLKIEHVFAKLWPRIRNATEIRSYLRNVNQANTYQPSMRCILASEHIDEHASSVGEGDGYTGRLETVSTDHHYQFTLYPLYTQQGGQLEAHALQVQDVTEQVRDEKYRSALLSSVSHDLRTPLTTIKAAVTGLLQADVAWDERDRLEMLEDIDSEADHLTVMVNALVELSRIEMGALILEKEWCDIVEVFYATLPKLRRVLATRTVRTRFQAHLPLIYADYAQLERIFYNLVENAARHSADGTEISVIVDTIENEALTMRIQVIDQGVTIPEQERERIFSSFYSQRTYGNGLGLAICKGIVEAHQGTIWVEAAPGGGSCFVFTLPTHPRLVVL
ncbi:MAG: hypothetical protein NVS2B12_06830 [Ktedonobacteraceae bacterium]